MAWNLLKIWYLLYNYISMAVRSRDGLKLALKNWCQQQYNNCPFPQTVILFRCLLAHNEKCWHTSVCQKTESSKNQITNNEQFRSRVFIFISFIPQIAFCLLISVVCPRACYYCRLAKDQRFYLLMSLIAICATCIFHSRLARVLASPGGKKLYENKT